MAKAAELNGYPGPAHVLALAAQLGLTESQLHDAQTIFERMSAAAKPLGGELIAQEQALHQLFAKSEITPDRLAAATAALPSCKVACGRCISLRISKPASCSPRISSLATSTFGAIVIRKLRGNLITMDRAG